MTKFKLWPVAVVLVSMLVLSGCASRTAGWFKSSDKVELSKKEMKEYKSKALAHWNKRHIKADLEKALDLYKTLAKSSENNYMYLARLTRGYYLLADAHYSDMDIKKKNWEIGISYGEKAMATNSDFAAAMKKGEKVEDHLDKLGREQIAAIYWTAANLGKWAKNSGIATTLKYKTRIKTLISTVQKLNPKFFYAAAYRYWGGYYAVAPGFAGGSMPKSKKMFEKAIKIAPEYLGTKVLYAHYYMVKEEDKKGFKRLLKEVINSKVKVKALFSENIIEKKKAIKMLESINELF